MHIIAIFVIIICLIAIAYRDLKIALISLGVILAAALLFYFLSPKTATDNAITSNIELKQPTISRGYANGFVLSTRIQNNQDTKLIQKVMIRSSLSDCDESQSKCLVIGEEDNIVKTRIPVGQARDIRVNLGIKQLNPITGEAVWAHKVIGVN